MMEIRCHHCGSIDPREYMAPMPCCMFGMKTWWTPPKVGPKQYVFNCTGKLSQPFGRDD